jgi:hypothetical protein
MPAFYYFSKKTNFTSLINDLEENIFLSQEMLSEIWQWSQFYSSVFFFKKKELKSHIYIMKEFYIKVFLSIYQAILLSAIMQNV